MKNFSPRFKKLKGSITLFKDAVSLIEQSQQTIKEYHEEIDKVTEHAIECNGDFLSNQDLITKTIIQVYQDKILVEEEKIQRSLNACGITE